MNFGVRRLAVTLALLVAVAATDARAENVVGLAGVISNSDGPGNSYGWELQFQEPLSPQTSASLSWLNEGHIPGHHRDGAAPQFWYAIPWLSEHMRLSVGAGPYFYFDTQQANSALGYRDAHNAAALLSAALDLDLTPSWFVRMNLNAVYAPGDFNTVGFMLGGGYRLGRGVYMDPGAAGGAPPVAAMRQQIQLFAGDVIYNDLNSQVDHSAGLEYRLALLPWLAWSATWFYESGAVTVARNQVATQLWLVDALQNGKIEFSAGLGVCTPLGAAPSGAASPAEVSGLSGLRVQWRFTARSSVILSWYRTFTNDDSDRDLIMLGYGFRFGGGHQ